jgi:hypothetical protein
MIILDTNVISALMRHSPDENVISWLDRQPRTSIWISAITLLEVRFGLQLLPNSKRRSFLMQVFEEVLERIEHRVVSLDANAAQQAGDLMALRQKHGRTVDLRDTMIAGIALAQRATLATRNTAHFEDTQVSIVNPWTD